MTYAEKLDNWLRVTFSKRRLCYVYFYYIEKGVDLKQPRELMEPYLAWVHPKENMKNVTPLFEAKVKKGRNIQLKRILITPIPNIAVI